jgi:FixJ family two-component response regulator
MLGVSDYLRKPFAMDVMLEAVEKALTGESGAADDTDSDADAAPAARKKAPRKKAD